VKVTPWHDYADPEERRSYKIQPIRNPGLVSGWSAQRSGLFTLEKIRVPIVREDGWASGTVWTTQKISPPPGFNPRTVQAVASRDTTNTILASEYTHLYIRRSPAEIEAPTNWNLLGRSTTFPPIMLSPNSSLPPPSSHCDFQSREEKFGARLKIIIT
jgi:hypothetical protein